MADLPPTIMLVHGAFHGSWCWEPLQASLTALGIASAAVDNPSVAQPGSDLAADGDNLTAALDAVAGPVVLVGHSYAGAVVTDAGAHPNVAHIVYLTALALDAGESMVANELVGGERMSLAEALIFEDDMLRVEPDRVVELFYHDCAPDVAAAAAAKVRPMSLAAMAAAPRAVAWREKPSTYVVCTDDRALPVALQRSCAQRVGTTLELPTSHSPFLSRPDDLATMLAGFVTG